MTPPACLCSFQPDPTHLGQAVAIVIAIHYIPAGSTHGKALWLMRSGASEWKLWDGALGRLERAEYRRNVGEQEHVGIFYGRFTQLPGHFTIHTGYRVGDMVVFDSSSPLEFVVE
jgi:hypothetical protein